MTTPNGIETMDLPAAEAAGAILRRVSGPRDSQTSSTRNSPPQVSRPSPQGVPPSLRDDLVPEGVINAARDSVARSLWPLLLTGPTGTGKTCAAAVLYQRWRGSNPMWRSFPTLCSLLSQCRRNGEASELVLGQTVVYTESQLWHRIAGADLLVLDEIGVRDDGGMRLEAMWRLLELRIGRPMIATTNVAPAGLTTVFDDRIASRLLAGRVVELVGADLRMSGLRSRVSRVTVGESP